MSHDHVITNLHFYMKYSIKMVRVCTSITELREIRFIFRALKPKGIVGICDF